MRTFGIIGHPLGHTMSPALHNWGFARFGLDAKYHAWPTPPEQLPAFLHRFREEHLSGLSVTIPHKRAVMEYVDRLTERAQAVGAVNTLWWDRETLVGDNTDVAGVAVPLQTRFPNAQSVMILGAGGAARAAVAACRELGIPDIRISNRTPAKAEAIARQFSISVTDWNDRHLLPPDLLINTTPLGMQGKWESHSPWEADFAGVQAVFDLVYNPQHTLLLRKAAQAGCTTIQGLEMFLCQGLEQFRLWTGKELDPEKARTMLLSELASSC